MAERIPSEMSDQDSVLDEPSIASDEDTVIGQGDVDTELENIAWKFTGETTLGLAEQHQEANRLNSFLTDKSNKLSQPALERADTLLDRLRDTRWDKEDFNATFGSEARHVDMVLKSPAGFNQVEKILEDLKERSFSEVWRDAKERVSHAEDIRALLVAGVLLRDANRAHANSPRDIGQLPDMDSYKKQHDNLETVLLGDYICRLAESHYFQEAGDEQIAQLALKRNGAEDINHTIDQFRPYLLSERVPKIVKQNIKKTVATLRVARRSLETARDAIDLGANNATAIPKRGQTSPEDIFITPGKLTEADVVAATAMEQEQAMVELTRDLSYATLQKLSEPARTQRLEKLINEQHNPDWRRRQAQQELARWREEDINIAYIDWIYQVVHTVSIESGNSEKLQTSVDNNNSANREKHRKKYAELMQNELGYGDTLQEGGFLNNITSNWLEPLAAKMQMFRNPLKWFSRHGQQELQVARHDLADTYRQAAESAESNLDGIQREILRELADRLEQITLREMQGGFEPQRDLVEPWKQLLPILPDTSVEEDDDDLIIDDADEAENKYPVPPMLPMPDGTYEPKRRGRSWWRIIFPFLN